jgi:hypothetical protein
MGLVLSFNANMLAEGQIVASIGKRLRGRPERLANFGFLSICEVRNSSKSLLRIQSRRGSTTVHLGSLGAPRRFLQVIDHNTHVFSRHDKAQFVIDDS